MYKNCSECQKQFCTQHVLPRFELGIFMYWTCNSMNNLSSYCRLIDTKIRASDKDLPVCTCSSKILSCYLFYEFEKDTNGWGDDFASHLWFGHSLNYISFGFLPWGILNTMTINCEILSKNYDSFSYTCIIRYINQARLF